MNPPASRKATTPPATVSSATSVRLLLRVRLRKARWTDVESTSICLDSMSGLYMPSTWHVVHHDWRGRRHGVMFREAGLKLVRGYVRLPKRIFTKYRMGDRSRTSASEKCAGCHRWTRGGWWRSPADARPVGDRKVLDRRLRCVRYCQLQSTGRGAGVHHRPIEAKC